MELPHIGENCAVRQCNRLDFLPVKCDACSGVFCLEHYLYDNHGCETAKNKDNQVPVCPLCMKPVVGKKGQMPDIAVSEHIDQYCLKNDLLKNYQRKKPSNSSLQACTFKSCKQKDVIYLECNDCRQKYCIKHRYPTDHSCSGPSSRVGASLSSNWNSIKESCSTNASSSYSRLKDRAQQITKSGQAALNRITSAGSSGATFVNPARSRNVAADSGARAVNNLQGNLSEQEALAIAMRESIEGTRPANSQEDEDAALARALHESELQSRNRERNATRGGSQKDTCILS